MNFDGPFQSQREMNEPRHSGIVFPLDFGLEDLYAPVRF